VIVEPGAGAAASFPTTSMRPPERRSARRGVRRGGEGAQADEAEAARLRDGQVLIGFSIRWRIARASHGWLLRA